MSAPEQEDRDARRKRTIWLLAGGAASLLLPLLGVVYIRLSESSGMRAPSASVSFDQREAGEAKISVSQSVAIVNPPAGRPTAAPDATTGAKALSRAPGDAGSSLSFVKGSGDYFQDKTAEAPKASTPAAAAPAPEPAKTPPKKSGKKAFHMPKLQGVKGFNNFKGGSPKPTGGGDVQDVLKNLPAGAENNPEIQKLLQKRGR